MVCLTVVLHGNEEFGKGPDISYLGNERTLFLKKLRMEAADEGGQQCASPVEAAPEHLRFKGIGRDLVPEAIRLTERSSDAFGQRSRLKLHREWRWGLCVPTLSDGWQTAATILVISPILLRFWQVDLLMQPCPQSSCLRGVPTGVRTGRGSVNASAATGRCRCFRWRSGSCRPCWRR